MNETIDEFQQGDSISDPRFREKLNGMRTICNSVKRIQGPGVTHLPDGVSIKPTSTPGVAGMFPVYVLKDGGSDGGSTTVATWTYTVSDLTGAQLIAAGTVTRRRPNGSMLTYGTVRGYGVGFYDENQSFKLWDAGEIPATGTCVGTC